MNPNMGNEKLREVVEKLGFTNVRTVISSGNVIFDSRSKSVKNLEEIIEKAWPKQLGFRSTTIIRSQRQIEQLVEENPFKGKQHSQKSNLNVTFLKNKTRAKLKFPYKVENRDYALVAIYHGDTICSAFDLTSSKTPDLMIWLEKKFGKEITTRTWNTVLRILKAM